MKAAVLCSVAVAVAVAAMGGSVAGILPPPDRHYKFLMLLPVSSKSHRNMFLALADALADRGHKIVMVTNHPAVATHPNIHEIHHGLKHVNMTDMFNRGREMSGAYAHFQYFLPSMARDLYDVPSVKRLYEKRKEFDLIIVNHMFNEIVYPFVHEVPFITVATLSMDQRQSAVLGNVLNPSYAPSIQISAKFPDLPPLLEIERNQSLTLVNTHFSITTPVPLLPSQVEVGAMHCRPAKPLPQDLEAWITGAGSAGVIYFSLGSVAHGETLPPKYRQVFVEAFRRLPQRVLWKYEGELEGVSDNVRIRSWLPQQDILAHHNVRVFISHGGLLSLQESVYHNTPLLVLPIFGDQPKNGMFVENSGLGHMLVWEELTADSIVDALTDIVSSPRYKDKVAAMSASLRDQLTTPQERAVFWTEYVIRHRGAPQLRCPAAQLSWVEFLMLDVVGLLLLALLLLLFLVRQLLRCVSAALLGGGGKKKRD